MSTWLEEERILFSCDFFGSHLATSELYADEDAAYERGEAVLRADHDALREAGREEPGKSVRAARSALIAPSHGPICTTSRDRDGRLARLGLRAAEEPGAHRLRLHARQHATDGGAPGEALVARGVEVRVFDFERPELDRYASALVDAGAVVFAAPAVWGGPHPAVLTAMGVTAGLKPKAHTAAFAGVLRLEPQGPRHLRRTAGRLEGGGASAGALRRPARSGHPAGAGRAGR